MADINERQISPLGALGGGAPTPMQPMTPMQEPPQGQPMMPMQPGVLGKAPQEVTSPIQQITKMIMDHEGLEPFQTPIRITNPKMKKWVSVYDDTVKIPLNPGAVKSKGRENFLYLQNQEDLVPLITEQFRRYTENPKKYGLPNNPTLSQAIRVFDQTGAEGKLKFMQKLGVDPNIPLKSLYKLPRQPNQEPTGSSYIPQNPANTASAGVRG